MIAPIERPEYYLDGVKLDKIKQLEDGLYVAFVDFPDGEGTFYEAQEVVRCYLHLKGENGTIKSNKTKYSGKRCVSVFFTI